MGLVSCLLSLCARAIDFTYVGVASNLMPLNTRQRSRNKENRHQATDDVRRRTV